MDGSWINVLSERRDDATRYGVPIRQSAAQRLPSVDQTVLLGLVCSALAGWWSVDPRGASEALITTVAIVFCGLGAWRVTLVLVSRRPAVGPPPQPSAGMALALRLAL